MQQADLHITDAQRFADGLDHQGQDGAINIGDRVREHQNRHHVPGVGFAGIILG